MESMSRIYKVLEETFDSIKSSWRSTAEGAIACDFTNENKTYFKKSMKIVTVEAMTNPTTEVMGWPPC